MENLPNFSRSTLSIAIGANETVLLVASAASFPAVTFRILIDNELLKVTAVDGRNFTVERGIEGTTATPHAANVDVIGVATAGAMAQFVAENGPDIEIDDVDGLQAALDGKAATSHTQAISTVTGLQTALDSNAAAAAAAQSTADGKQTLNANLTALAGQTGAADRVSYWTAAGTLALAVFTSFGRSIVAAANAAGLRTLLELGSAALAAATDFLSSAPGSSTRNKIKPSGNFIPVVIELADGQLVDGFVIQTHNGALTLLRLQADGTLNVGPKFSVRSSDTFGNPIAVIEGPDPNHAIWMRVGQNGNTDTMNYYEYGAHRFYAGGGIASQPLILTIDNGGLTTPLPFESTVGGGIAPLVVASNTLVANLNADLLDGKEATAFVEYVSAGVLPSASGANLTNVDAVTLGGTALTTINAAIAAAQATADAAASSATAAAAAAAAAQSTADSANTTAGGATSAAATAQSTADSANTTAVAAASAAAAAQATADSKLSGNGVSGSGTNVTAANGLVSSIF